MLARMLSIFVATIAPGHDPNQLLSKETLEETQAQVMTAAEAQAVGITGVAVPQGREVRLIAVAQRDARWVQRALEANPAVTSYKVTEVG